MARHRQTPKQLQAARESFRDRLVHANPSEVEQGIGGFLPQRLIALYADHLTVLTEEIEVRRPESGDGEKCSEWIEAFLPLDWKAKSTQSTRRSEAGAKASALPRTAPAISIGFRLATHAGPTLRYILPATTPFGNEQVASTLEEFLSWPRTLHGQERQEK